MKTRQVPWSERISYGLTETGFNLVFVLVSTYLMYFYTDIFDIPVAAIAPLFFIGRIIDGVTDPFEGILIDRTNTRWGKCRPFWLWFTIPFCVFGVLTFSAPELGLAGKIIYMYVTYIGLNLFISLIALPTQAMLPSLTSDTQERTVINVIRTLLGAVGSLVISAATWPLVNALGQGNGRTGFFLTALLFAVIGAALLFNGWAHTKERVQPDGGKPIPVKKGLKSIMNLPWVLLLVMAIVANLCTVLKQTSTPYYLQYYIGKPELMSALLTFPTIAVLIILAFSPLIAKKMGKRNASLMGIVVAILGAVIIIISEQNVFLLFLGTILNYVGLGIPAGLLGAMFADTVDYAEWKSGTRATGLAYSACSLGVKIGQGLGGALCATILAIGHYVPNVEQTPEALGAIKFNYAWVTLIASVLLFALILLYKVDKLHPQIMSDLEQRRQAEA